MTMSENALSASIALSRLTQSKPVDPVDYVAISRAGREGDVKMVTELLTKYHTHLQIYKLFDKWVYLTTDTVFEYLVKYVDTLTNCGGIEWYDRLNCLISELVKADMPTKIKILMKYWHPASPFAIKWTMSVQDVVGCGMVCAANYGHTGLITLLSYYIENKYVRWTDMRDKARNAETLKFIEDMAINNDFYDRLTNGKYDGLSPKDGKYLKLTVEW
jgi:hypothetical protein